MRSGARQAGVWKRQVRAARRPAIRPMGPPAGVVEQGVMLIFFGYVMFILLGLGFACRVLLFVIVFSFSCCVCDGYIRRSCIFLGDLSIVWFVTWIHAFFWVFYIFLSCEDAGAFGVLCSSVFLLFLFVFSCVCFLVVLFKNRCRCCCLS